MSKSVIALVVATLACGSASAYFYKELRTEREQVTTLKAQLAGLEKSHRTPTPAVRTELPPPTPAPSVAAATVENPKSPEVKFQASVVPAGNAVFAAAPLRGSPDPDMQRRMQQSMEQQRRMLQDPEYRALMRAQHKDGVRQMNGDLEIMLGLSHEEAERVLDILAEHQLRSMEQPGQWMHVDGSRPTEAQLRERQQAYEAQKRKNDAELANVLGSKYGEWQSYQQNMWSRSQVMQLRQSLSMSDEPLRPDQVKPLVETIAREQQQQSRNVRSNFAGFGRSPEDQLRMQEQWLEEQTQTQQRIRNSVSSLLTPAQMQRLEEQHERERKMRELNIKMQRARLAEAQARGEDISSPNAPAMLGSQGGFAAHP